MTAYMYNLKLSKKMLCQKINVTNSMKDMERETIKSDMDVQRSPQSK